MSAVPSEPAMAARLAGRVAVVTGAAGGIGSVTCERLAAEGATVVVADIDLDGGERVVKEVRARGLRAEACRLDVTSRDSWETAADLITEQHGAPHILVNNAGYGDLTTVESETDETWGRAVMVNQQGTWLGMQAFGSRMATLQRGSIVNIGSIWGAAGGFGTHFSYHGAKGAVRSMTKSAAVLWGPSGVRVNCLHPGFIATPASDERWADHPRRPLMIDRTPLGRFGRPAEIAGVVAFLASDDSSFMTGTDVFVDGGYTVR